MEENDMSLDDFTLEEIQEFMETDEFNQLDEISKGLAISYVRKAIGSAKTLADKDKDKAARRGKFLKKAIDKVTEDLDESIHHDHIQQTLADKDINSKIEGGKVVVHKDNLSKAKAHVRKLGHKIEVTSGLNEEELQEKSMQAKQNKAAKNTRDVLLGARHNMKSGVKLTPDDTGHDSKQAMNKAIGRALRREQVELTLEDFTLEEIQEYLDSEEGQQLDELSKKTLGNYISQAAGSTKGAASHAYQAAASTSDDIKHSHIRKSFKRIDGISRAAKKLAKEEVELTLEDFTPEEIQEYLDSEEGQQLDELSKTTLGNYLTKAIDKKSQLAVNNTRKATNDSVGKYYKRSAGIKVAIGKLTKEDTDQELEEAQSVEYKHNGKQLLRRADKGQWKPHNKNVEFSHNGSETLHRVDKGQWKPLPAGHKYLKEDIDLVEKVVSDNPEHGYSGQNANKYSSTHAKVKKVLGNAMLLSNEKKPNHVVKSYLDSSHGRHLSGREDDAEYIKSDFQKFYKKHKQIKEEIMLETKLELIDLIANGKTSEAIDKFEELAAEVAFNAVEAKRDEIRASMFGESVEEELTLEDFTPEEIQEYLDSEEGQQLDELSKTTLGSYVKKASMDAAVRADKGGSLMGSGKNGAAKQYAKANSRIRGIGKAVSKLTEEDIEDDVSIEDFTIEEIQEFIESEEYEQLDELSKATLGSYIKKAHASGSEHAHKLGTQRQKADEIDKFTNDNSFARGTRDTLKKDAGVDIHSQDKTMEKVYKRHRGISKAVGKLTK